MVELLSAKRLDGDSQGLRVADGVGQLHLHTVRQAGRYQVLGYVAGGVGGRAVHLGGVLAGVGAAAVAAYAPIRIDDVLAAGEPGVPGGSAQDEGAATVDEDVRALVH